MEALDAAFDHVEAREKTLEVYGRDAVGSELEEQFATRNVRVTDNTFPSAEFVIVRDADGEFRGALGIDTLRAIVSPESRPRWALSGDAGDMSDLFDFLDNTLFTAYDRRRMLAVSREIEDRAWRTGTGTLYAGFQKAERFEAQVPVYARFVRESDVAVRVFIEDDWERHAALDAGIDLVADGGEEIGQYWFVLFDGGGSERNACGLVAEERAPGEYYGFWTNDDLVGELFGYLRSAYPD